MIQNLSYCLFFEKIIAFVKSTVSKKNQTLSININFFKFALYLVVNSITKIDIGSISR